MLPTLSLSTLNRLCFPKHPKTDMMTHTGIDKMQTKLTLIDMGSLDLSTASQTKLKPGRNQALTKN